MAGTVSAESDCGHFNYNREILGWKPSTHSNSQQIIPLQRAGSGRQDVGYPGESQREPTWTPQSSSTETPGTL